VAESANLGAALRTARQRLDAAGSEDAVTEVRLLAEWAFGLTRLELVIKAEMPVDPTVLQAFEAALIRRLAGEPVHRIMGFREFFGMRLELSEATLEPRADTEALVELVCDLVTAKGRRDDELAMLDLGTGTGAIALALLTVLKNAKASVTDVDQHALETAMKNARTHGLASRLIALAGSWFNPVEGRFDLIVSNPPYIPSAVVPTLDIEVRDHDPRAALDGGADGLDPYRAIAAGAGKHLAPEGVVAVEIGFDQAWAVTAIFIASGFALLELRKDMGGRDRALAFALR
jgi:release factor glutamine methyltransferase